MHKLFHPYVNGYGFINFNPSTNGAVDNGNTILELAFALVSSDYKDYSAVQFRSAILPHIKNDILYRVGVGDRVSYDEYIAAISAALFYAPEIALRLSEKLIREGFIVGGEDEIRNNFSRFLGFPAFVFLASGVKPTLLEQLSFMLRLARHSVFVLKKSTTDWSGVRMSHMICRALGSVKNTPNLMKLSAAIFRSCLALGPHKTAANIYYSYYHPDHSVRDVHLALGLKW
jgi:hypothetical protein